MIKGDVGQVCADRLKPGQIAVDVGASNGCISRKMLEAGATVIAFEPDDRYEAIAGVTLHRVALGDRSDEVRFYRGEAKQESSLWEGNYKNVSHHVMVPMRRLDDLVEAADLVKIDAQGAEVAILDGCPRLLRSCPTWVMELWPAGLSRAGASGEALLSRLWSAGLQTWWLDGSELTAESYQQWLSHGKVYVNILAVR